MLFRKTPTAARKEYVYRFCNGEESVIAGGGDAAVWVKALHRMDDHEVYNNIKNNKCQDVLADKEEVRIWEELHPEDKKNKWGLSLDSYREIDPDATEIARKLADSHEEDPDYRKEILYDVLSTLPEGDQILYFLYFVEDYSQAEIAEMRGVSQYAVSKRLSRIKRDLTDACKKSF